MMVLILLALIAAVAKLWVDLAALRQRVRAMELGDAPAPALGDFPADWAAPHRRPAEPLRTARVVHTAAEPPEFRHPGLAPESRSFSPARGSEAPDQVRVDEAARTEEPQARHPRESGEPAPAIAPGVPEETGPRPCADDETARTDAAAPATPRPAFSFEDIFGRKLPIWAGGITLAVCGFLIVKYSIDAGLLSPLVRVIGGLLFGSGLIAGAEAALRNDDRVRDPRVAQALSGAGVATLYASVLVAVNLYHLLPPLTAFAGLAAITVLAGFLSIRYGAPSAVLGLVGGLAAPALVGTGNPNVPLLAAYLALAVGGLATLGRAQRWWWLGVAALIGGFGWGLVLILGGALDLTDSLAVGGFLLLLGIGLPVALFGGERGTLVRLGGTLAAAAQLAALVATGGFAMLHWGLFGLLGLASVWLSRRERPLADLPAVALAIALLSAVAWPDPTMRDLAVVVSGAALIFGLPAAWRAWRPTARLSDAAGVAALAAAPLVLWLLHFDPTERTATLLALVGAAAATLVTTLGWHHPARRADPRFALLASTAALLLACAVPFALATAWIAPAWAVIAGATLLLARLAGDRRLDASAWLLLAVATVALPFHPLLSQGRALDRAYGEGQALAHLLDGREALRWAIVTAVAALFAWRGAGPVAKRLGAILAVLLGYVALAQVVPPALLPLVPAAAMLGLGLWRRSDVATATAAVLAGLWAVWPLAQWLAVGGGALLGMWARVDALPPLADGATRLLAPGVAAALLFRRAPPAERRLRHAWIAGLALLGTACVHIAFKQLFAIHGFEQFVARGLAERTVWEALLVVVALALHRRLPNIVRGLAIAAGAHLAWFTFLIHNPLWAEQAVGGAPLANLLLPAYALGFALLWAAGRQPLPALAARARGWAQMLLVLLFAASELRQLCHGTLLVGAPVGQGEDIARSVLAVMLGIGFLLYGINARARDWRIASLLLMLGAVAKVFLLDASGLDGLARIASFAALGFSLIGIGWLYSRYLPDGAGASGVGTAASPITSTAEAGAQMRAAED